MEIGDINIKLLETGANVRFGLTLAIYAELADALFPNAPVNVVAVEEYLAEHNIKISRRRLYELNQYRACVNADWFREALLRDEIKVLQQATANDSATSSAHLNTNNRQLIIASKIASAVDLRLSEGEYCPYIVNTSSIKRKDPRGATIAFALLLAIPIFNYGRQRKQQQSILDQAQTWPEPILTDTLEHFIIELARNIGYSSAWALTSGIRIFHEDYIEPWISKDYCTLLGIK
ncbi:hypothetical protein [Oceanisphaera pacifica]|uniref:Uncharacterized protein n=1 Tax=Oceanisphaera pacifica TaxID=2818389 RepID=A0ABS3NJD7_9GAMM|nr:hypothetical protein [Oceanisphaera pacifica]MBO1520427.1 hypothetical protein [Oceanisphaera pacifica]